MNRAQMDRRRFIAGALGGVVVLHACAPAPLRSQPRAIAGSARFAQGVASADPHPDAVLLWTRVEPLQAGDVSLVLQVSKRADFDRVVVEEKVVASAAFDNTVRARIEGLEPDCFYWFRFIAPDGAVSRTGRTRTAPSPLDGRSVRVALFSCQHYESGFFTAYRRLLADDAALPLTDQLHGIIHVGDFIYESAGGKLPSQDGAIIDLVNQDGSRRSVKPFPSGGVPGGPGGPTSRVAVSIDDYRLLYRTYLSDPDLAEARALYPFIQIWDDHEFLNDSWQGFGADQALQRQRYEATKAWFEYCPAMLATTRQSDEAFVAAEVTNAPAGPPDANADFLVNEPNNLAAIGALTIYRNLRLGRHVDLILTDSRSYRGPRGLDDAILDTGELKYPAAPIPPEIIAIQAAGREANGGNPPATITLRGKELPNNRRDTPATTMLGKLQQAWLERTLAASEATWRALVTSTPLMRFGFDMRFREPDLANGLLWTDGWDGYPNARRALVDHIVSRGYGNVVSLTGDRHAHFAGSVRADFDDEASPEVFPEFVCTGASAVCRAKAQALNFGKDQELIRRASVETEPGRYHTRMAPTLNAWLMAGSEAADALGPQLDVAAATKAARDDVNTHLAYADTDAYGYTVIAFSAQKVTADFVTLREPLDQRFDALRRVRFSAGRGSGESWPIPRLETMEGQPPLMGLRNPVQNRTDKA